MSCVSLTRLYKGLKQDNVVDLVGKWKGALMYVAGGTSQVLTFLS